MDLEREYLLQNYARYPLVLARGKGCYVYDLDGQPLPGFHLRHRRQRAGPRATRGS